MVGIADFVGSGSRYRRFAALVASIADFVGSGSKSQVLDTSILDTRGERSEPIPAGEARGSERDSSGTTCAARSASK